MERKISDRVNVLKSLARNLQLFSLNIKIQLLSLDSESRDLCDLCDTVESLNASVQETLVDVDGLIAETQRKDLGAVEERLEKILIEVTANVESVTSAYERLKGVKSVDEDILGDSSRDPIAAISIDTLRPNLTAAPADTYDDLDHALKRLRKVVNC
jgi:hypothetical protein